nr:AAA family ATPase [Micromonospora sp. DSM 115978]
MRLLERDDELAQLLDISGRCFDGEGRVVTVSGAVATGKTELLGTFAERVTAHGAQFVGATGAYTEKALPLGVVGQLFYDARLPDSRRESVLQMLHEGMLSPLVSAAHPRIDDVLYRQLLDDICAELLGMAKERPLVIGIDDLHHADPHSLQFLAYLIRRSRSAPVMLVLNESAGLGFTSVLDPRLLAPPRWHRIHLEPLSVGSVHTLMRRRLGVGAADRFARTAHTLSGGNPLLLGALIDDSDTGQRNTRRLVAGKGFGQAFLRCLYRCDPIAVAVARWLAVLDESASTARLAHLTGHAPERVEQTIRTLDTAGLLVAGRFTYASRSAVLDGLEAEARAGMHARAAEVLYRDGAPIGEVAEHLMAADESRPDWALPVLRTAAMQALAADNTELAIDFLRLALHADASPPERAETLALLANAHLRVDPSGAARHLRELAVSARAGHLTGQRALALVGWLSWFGQVEEAVDLMAQLRTSAARTDRSLQNGLRDTRLHLAHLYPSTLRPLRRQPTAPARRPVRPDRIDHPEQWAANLLAGVLTGQADTALVHAEQQLRRFHLGESTWRTIRTVITALLYGDDLVAARRSCEWFLDRASAKGAVVWQAVLTCLRADIALRRGDLSAAESDARTALSLLPPANWGILVGHPVALLVRACCLLNRPEDALGHLRLPVPDAMFRSTVGLLYLHARGVYHHASGSYPAALSDFRTCGELMRRWDVDLPRLMPWRTEAARTHLHLGEPDRAQELAAAQLARLSPQSGRAYGAALRVLAATRAPTERLGLLEQAVEALSGSADRIELAAALVDLSQECDALGQTDRARIHAHNARGIATVCGLPPTRPTPTRPTRAWTASAGGSAGSPTTGQHPEPLAHRVTELSEAERRVVLLASQGLTNRQVAAELHVTVSTVEQHLTRIYRKLQVSSRADLPVALQAVDDAYLARLP